VFPDSPQNKKITTKYEKSPQNKEKSPQNKK